jgi:hypothetical protein
MFRVRKAPHRWWIRAQLFNLSECVVQLFLIMLRLFFEQSSLLFGFRRLVLCAV